MATVWDIPTVAEVNSALSKLNVSNENPKQVIDLGYGQQIVARVGVKQNSKADETIGIEWLQNETAYGQIDYVNFGVTFFSLGISENYSYNDGSADIVSYQDPPSVSTYAAIGWSSSVTSKYVRNIDPKVQDAIDDASYSALKYGATKSGHIELRFTGAGNYYIHDSYWM